MTIDLQRRKLLALAAASGAAAFLPRLAGAAENLTVRIGYQKSSTLITVLKANGTLEKRLEPLGAKISWHEFTSGLPLLEALNVGSVDFSADVADTVPVFALAAGAKLAYVAQEAPSPSAQALVVKADSAIRSVADLKGKRVAVAKAAGAHYLLIALLEKNGLKFKDIEPAYLTPADGRAAFERGSVDAWVIWDPYTAAAQQQIGARIVADGTGVVNNYGFFLAEREFASKQGEVIKQLFDELQQHGLWITKNYKAAATRIAPLQGLDTAVVEQTLRNFSHIIKPISEPVLDAQQKLGDTFFELKLIPKAIRVKDASLAGK